MTTAQRRIDAGEAGRIGASGPDDAPTSDALRWRDRKRLRVLSPVARLADIIVALVIALAVIGAVSVTGGGRDETRRVLAAALGSACAWGTVAAILYLIATALEHRRGRALLEALRAETDPERARSLIAESLPPLVAASIQPAELERIRRQLAGMQELHWARLGGREVTAATGLFLLVFGSTLPVIAPFLLPLPPRAALWLSGAIALVSLFVTGYRLGMRVSGRPALIGTAMFLVGALLVTIVLAIRG